MPQPQTDAATAEQSSPPKRRTLEAHFLERWGRVRGPLFACERVVVCRAVALSAAMHVMRGSPDPAVRHRASKVVDEALREVPDSNNPATGEQYARASAALADVMRMGRALSWQDDLAGELAHYFVARKKGGSEKEEPDEDAGGDGNDDFEHFRHYAWGELLASLFLSHDESLKLRAARTLLAWTRDDARKKGRERRRAWTPEVMAVLEEIRGEVRAWRDAAGFSEGGAKDTPESAPPSRRACGPPQGERTKHAGEKKITEMRN